MSYVSVTTGLDGSGSGVAQVQHPQNQRRPYLIGQGRPGALLRIDPGSWSPGSLLSFRWICNGVPLAGQEEATYVVQPDDANTLICCYVKAQNQYGSLTLSTPVLPIWPNTTVPSWGFALLSGGFEIQRAPGMFPPDASGLDMPSWTVEIQGTAFEIKNALSHA